VTELSTELQEERQNAATSTLVKEKKGEEDYKRIMELGRLLQKEREKTISLEQEGKAKAAQAAQSVEQSDQPTGKMRGRSKTMTNVKKPATAAVVAAPIQAVAAPVAQNQDSLRLRAQLLEYRKLQQEQASVEARLAGL